MKKAYMYILRCSNGKFYTGSTRNLKHRTDQHFFGVGSNFTSKHKTLSLVYYEEFDHIDEAYQREKQIQKWSHAKKEALINGDIKRLKELSRCRNISKSKQSKK